MKQFLKDTLKDNKEIYKKCLYIIFVLSYLFNTAFKISMGGNYDIIAYYFRMAFDKVTLLKNNILIPLLLIIEIVDLIYKIKNKEYTRKQFTNFLLFLVTYVLLRIYGYGTHHWGYDEVILLIYFAKYLEFKNIMYLYTGSVLISALFNIWRCFKGYLPIDGPGRGLVWGFSHSNQAAIFYTMLFFGMAYCKKNKIVVALISIPFLYLNFAIFKSRTPCIVMILFVVMLCFENVYDNLKSRKLINLIFVLFPIIMTLLAIFLGILIYNGILKIDPNASARFNEFVIIYKENGLALGNRDLSSFARFYYFDNGYAWMIYRHGLLTSGLMYLIWTLNNKRIVKDDNYILMIICISLFIYMMMEYIFVNDLIFVTMTYYTSKKEILTR